MQEVSKLSAQREELHETIRSIPDEYLEKALKLLRVLIEPTDAEIEKYWKENIDSLEPSDVVVTSDDMESLDKMEFKNWKDIKDSI